MTTRTSYRFKNSTGYEEHVFFRYNVFKKINRQKTIWFIGDSFTYGFGLENTSQTFPAITELLLNNKFTCINLGDGGADTRREKEIFFEITKKTTQAPKAVVWQYFGNDIDGIDSFPEIYMQAHGTSAIMRLGSTFFKAKSFLLDYIYWELFVQNERSLIRGYNTFLESLYLNDSSVAYRKHLEHIIQVNNYCKQNEIKFLVVVFPYLWQNGPENSLLLYTNRVCKDLHAFDIDAVDITPLVINLPVKERVANSHDPHPSALVNKLVSDTIAGYLKKSL